MRRLLYAAAGICFGMSAKFFIMFYDFYLRPEFNEMGRSFDETAGAVLSDGNFVWAIPAAGFLAAGIAILIRVLRKNKGA